MMSILSEKVNLIVFFFYLVRKEKDNKLKSNLILDNWILLTFENGDIYNNVCDNLTRTASIILLCGSAKVRIKRKNEKIIDLQIIFMVHFLNKNT